MEKTKNDRRTKEQAFKHYMANAFIITFAITFIIVLAMNLVLGIESTEHLTNKYIKVPIGVWYAFLIMGGMVGIIYFKIRNLIHKMGGKEID